MRDFVKFTTVQNISITPVPLMNVFHWIFDLFKL